MKTVLILGSVLSVAGLVAKYVVPLLDKSSNAYIFSEEEDESVDADHWPYTRRP